MCMLCLTYILFFKIYNIFKPNQKNQDPISSKNVPSYMHIHMTTREIIWPRRLVVL